jgi:hypothetical protein
LVAGTEQGREITDGPQLGIHLAQLSLNSCLFDLQAGEDLPLPDPLGSEFRKRLARADNSAWLI